MSIKQRVERLEKEQRGGRPVIRVSLVDNIDPNLPDRERRPDGTVIIRVKGNE